MTRPFETAALIFRAAVSLRLHKPMTTCRDTVADWRVIDLPCPVYFFKAHNLLRHTYITNLLYAGVDPKTVQYLAGHENIEYYTIANQKQARYNIDKKTKATATVQKIDFGCSHKEQIENRYPQWLKTQMCDACSKLFV